jgi:hypothetical protein
VLHPSDDAANKLWAQRMIFKEFYDAPGILLLEFLANADQYCITMQHLNLK